MSGKFIKKVENFVCDSCGVTIEGNGYTNHCPQCLWSKHVDIFPGDRAGKCGGMMEPVGVKKEGREYNILHKCIKCGFQKPNKAVPEDDFQMIVQISAENSK